MFPEIGNHTVLVFRQIQFHGDWSRAFGAESLITYTPQKKAAVLVLSEAEPGVWLTYLFEFDAGHDVCVSSAENEVYLPGLCVGAVRGNFLRCQKGLRAAQDAIKKSKGRTTESSD
jgi:hypothetical protein